MQDVQLISKDANLIAEIQKICAVTQATLSHSDLISESEISNTHTVLIDAQLDLVILALSNKVILQSCELKNDSVVIRVISDEAIQPWLDRWPKIGMARAGIDYAFG
jgi:hypothetical protein